MDEKKESTVLGLVPSDTYVGEPYEVPLRKWSMQTVGGKLVKCKEKDFVKAVVIYDEHKHSPGLDRCVTAERLWWKVLEVIGDTVVLKLASEPENIPDLKLGDELIFPRRVVIHNGGKKGNPDRCYCCGKPLHLN